MKNPFDDEEAKYFALTNMSNFCSLWPSFLDVPAGWNIIAGPGARSEILTLIEAGSDQNDRLDESIVADVKA